MSVNPPRIVAACSLKSGGTTTLLMTLASAALAEGREVRLVDMNRNRDLSRWAARWSGRRRVVAEPARTPEDVEAAIVAGLKAKALILIDPGTKPEKIRMAARYADLTLIPVRFSPLSAHWAAETDEMLSVEADFGRVRRRFFVATAITFIASRIARQVEAEIEAAASDRLDVGLALRAAHEAPFVHGGTIFDMADDAAPGLDKARAEALRLARAIGIVLAPAAERAAPAPTAGIAPLPCTAIDRPPLLPPLRPEAAGPGPFASRNEPAETDALVPA